MTAVVHLFYMPRISESWESKTRLKLSAAYSWMETFEIKPFPEQETKIANSNV